MTSVLNLIVYHSPLFAAHWALFLPSPTNAKIGRRIHADGSPASGFEVLFEEYDLTECTQRYKVIGLGVVEIKDLESVARSIEAPKKSLVSAAGMGSRRRIELKNCQTWVTNVIAKLTDSGLICADAIGLTRDAPKN